MDVHSELVSSAKSALSFDNIKYYKAEDSGYHTSFTPGSLEHSDICSDLDESLPPRTTYDVTPNYRRSRFGPLKVHNDISTDSRRGLKRPHSSTEVVKHVTTIPTPTTLLSGKIESLDVNEDKENSSVPIPPESPCSSNSSKRFLYRLQVPEPVLPFPPTPIKRNCRLGPCRSAKKLEFSTHSLLCKKNELQHVPEESSKIQLIPILARPNQKIDILRLLCETHATPAIENILQNLNNEDTRNFCLVSETWCQIWKMYSSKKKKRSYKEYLKSTQENRENSAKESKSKIRSRKVHGCLKDINNEIVENPVNKSVRSPPCSPRSNRFRKFTKSASLDSRLQLSCVKCSYPAKVTEEPTGEEWVECTSVSCSYQFCRACNCTRHPGKSCFRYDLNAPSPSKRKKCEYAVGTMKSKKNLRRLL